MQENPARSGTSIAPGCLFGLPVPLSSVKNQTLPNNMETKFSHEGPKAQSLMNAKCRVQNAKVKIKGYEIMARSHAAILQFAF
jgi:hypothetical protein